MNLSIGIVGLPNVGKSTLFSALTQRRVPAENFPFCTIEPNLGCVAVPDQRLEKIAETEQSQKTIYAIVEFVDIAGLVAGASKGEGLGNQFLANIRNCAAIAQVVRIFLDPNVTHVSGSIDPLRDVKIIETELQLADLATLEKRIKTAQKTELDLYQKIFNALNEGKNARDLSFSKEEQPLVKDLVLLTQKPVLYVLNISENQLSAREKIVQEFRKSLSSYRPSIADPVIPICAKIEAELSLMSSNEAKEFLQSFGLERSALDEIILAAFKTLGLITFFTANKKEAHAWQIKQGTTAYEAAGEIHSDFQKKFVKADVISFENFIEAGGWAKAYEKGKVHSQGRDYVVKDGDVIFVRHG